MSGRAKPDHKTRTARRTMRESGDRSRPSTPPPRTCSVAPLRGSADVDIAAHARPVRPLLRAAGSHQSAAHADQSAADQRDVAQREPDGGASRIRRGVLVVRRPLQPPAGRSAGGRNPATGRRPVRPHPKLLAAHRHPAVTGHPRGRALAAGRLGLRRRHGGVGRHLRRGAHSHHPAGPGATADSDTRGPPGAAGGGSSHEPDRPGHRRPHRRARAARRRVDGVDLRGCLGGRRRVHPRPADRDSTSRRRPGRGRPTGARGGR